MFTPATLFQVAACGTILSERIDALPVYERHRFIPGAVNRCSKLPCRELIQVVHHLFYSDVLSAKRTNTNRVPGGNHFSPPFVDELRIDPCGLSSKKEVPRDRNPREQPSTCFLVCLLASVYLRNYFTDNTHFAFYMTPLVITFFQHINAAVVINILADTVRMRCRLAIHLF